MIKQKAKSKSRSSSTKSTSGKRSAAAAREMPESSEVQSGGVPSADQQLKEEDKGMVHQDGDALAADDNSTEIHETVSNLATPPSVAQGASFAGKPGTSDVDDEEDDSQTALLGAFDNYGQPSPRPQYGRAREPHPDLSVRVTSALYHKLKEYAREEGITLEALIGELLSEGVTLRAWEIIERKNAMRGGGAHMGAPMGGNRHGNNGNRMHGHNPGGNNRYGHGGGRGPQGLPNNNNRGQRGANNAWMEDKAAFLEYVRNQEKRRR